MNCDAAILVAIDAAESGNARAAKEGRRRRCNLGEAVVILGKIQRAPKEWQFKLLVEILNFLPWQSQQRAKNRVLLGRRKQVVSFYQPCFGCEVPKHSAARSNVCHEAIDGHFLIPQWSDEPRILRSRSWTRPFDFQCGQINDANALGNELLVENIQMAFAFRKFVSGLALDEHNSSFLAILAKLNHVAV